MCDGSDSPDRLLPSHRLWNACHAVIMSGADLNTRDPTALSLISTIQKALEDGADVFFSSANRPHCNMEGVESKDRNDIPLLHMVVLGGNVSLFELCLSSSRHPYEAPSVNLSATPSFSAVSYPSLNACLPHTASPAKKVYNEGIDFCRADSERRTIFHLAVERWSSSSLPCGSPSLPAAEKEQVTVDMLKALFSRLQTHPEDMVDWSQVNASGLTFLQVLAEYQLLSTLSGALFETAPYYADQTDPISLASHAGTCVWDWDWQALPKDTLMTLDSNGTEETMAHIVDTQSHRSTALLCKLCWQGNPLLDDVAQCVLGGANVLCSFPNIPYFPRALWAPYHIMITTTTSLHWVLHANQNSSKVDLLAALLCTSQSINFSARDGNGYTVLGALLGSTMRPAMEVSSALVVILDRLASHPNDRVTWNEKDMMGLTFLNRAATVGKLSVVWPLIRQKAVAHFIPVIEGKKRITISRMHLKDDDWSRLSDKDRQCFVLGIRRPMRG